MYISTSRRRDVRMSGRPDVRTSGRPNVRTSGRPNVRTSGRPDDGTYLYTTGNKLNDRPVRVLYRDCAAQDAICSLRENRIEQNHKVGLGTGTPQNPRRTSDRRPYGRPSDVRTDVRTDVCTDVRRTSVVDSVRTSIRRPYGRSSDVHTDVRWMSVGRPYGRPYVRTDVRHTASARTVGC